MKDYFKHFIPENSQAQGISDVEIVPYSMQEEKFLNIDRKSTRLNSSHRT